MSRGFVNCNVARPGLVALLGMMVWASAAWAQVEVGPQIRIDVNGGPWAANETAMASTHVDPDEIVGVWNDWRDGQGGEIIRMGVAVSSDGGLSWDDFLVRPPVNFRTNVEGDPMTAYDNRTGDLWVGAIAFGGGMFVARKIPGQNAFEPSVMATERTSEDKCWMDAGPRPGNKNETNIYIGYNRGVIRSEDRGETWSVPVAVPRGIGFLPRVGPEGELYVAYWDFADGVMLLRSFDGGRNFGAPIRIATRMDVWGTQDGSRFPGRFRVPSLNYLAVDPNDGTLYCIYFDTPDPPGPKRNVDLYFTRSTKQGEKDSWTKPRVLNSDGDPPGDQFFPWIEVDQQSQLHIVFLDSRHTDQDDNVEHGMFDAYYAFSDDRGDSWLEIRLTPESFDSFDDGLNRGVSQFLGDYMGLGVGGDRVYPCYLSTQNGDPDIYTHIITVGGDPVPIACCFKNGKCKTLMRKKCIRRGGKSKFGETCDTFQCPQPGACCIDNATCEILLERDCSARGGDFKGEGEKCRRACPCDLIKKFKASCTGGGTVKALVKFRNKSRNGEFVEIGVGENLFKVEIKGKKARLFTCCFNGEQAVSLLDPEGCFDPIIVNCP